MQVTRHRLASNEIDHELVWSSVSIGSLGFATAWFAVGLPWPPCFFHDLTGLPCPTCGATRSAIEFLHGHFLGALRWNPLVFSGLCALSIFNVYAFLILITRAGRFRIANVTIREKRFIRAGIVVLITLNWVYLLSHWRRY